MAMNKIYWVKWEKRFKEVHLDCSWVRGMTSVKVLILPSYALHWVPSTVSSESSKSSQTKLQTVVLHRNELDKSNLLQQQKKHDLYLCNILVLTCLAQNTFKYLLKLDHRISHNATELYLLLDYPCLVMPRWFKCNSPISIRNVWSPSFTLDNQLGEFSSLY